MTTKRIASPLSVLCLLLAGAVMNGRAQEGNQAMMTNDTWQLTVEPRWGGRASRLRSLKHDYDFVSTWKPKKTETHKTGKAAAAEMTGGALRTMMSGSYNSSQPQEPYAVVRSSATELVLTYDNKHPLLNGLHEDRVIRLEGPSVVLSIKVTNTAAEDRTLYYRLHDFIGVGLNRGLDSVFVTPWEKDEPCVFAASGKTVYRPFIHPAENWFALADLAGDRGLLVTVEKGGVAGFFFWGSADDPMSRTAEIFFPRTPLAPGASWELELRYTAFSPSAPDLKDPRLAALLAAGPVAERLARAGEHLIRAGLPYDAAMALPIGDEPAVLFPVHLIDPALAGGAVPAYGKTLEGVRLYGTPGEAVPLVFGITASTRLAKGQVAWSGLLPGLTVETRYVAGASGLLVKSWALSRNIPLDTIGAINNGVKDAAALTPFDLEAGETAYVYSLLRIPDNAAGGLYQGRCTVGPEDGKPLTFDIALTVRPFRLTRAKHKTYGGFFRYFIKGDEDKESLADTALSREIFLEALRSVADAGYNGLVLYVANRDALIWALGKCRELGMTGAFVLCRSGALTREDIESLTPSYNILGWGVDEPTRYSQIPSLMRKYESIRARGLTPVFTPNLPLGLLAADSLKGIVPIIAMSGNMAYGIEATRRYKAEGRQVFWYRTGQAAATVEQRVFRGIYLWKEPVDGLFDWGEDSVAPRLTNNQLAGFAGTEVIPRLGRENIRQALIDLDYLHTLEQRTAQCREGALRARADALIRWIKTTFGDDWYLALEPIQNPQYLDDIRQSVAEMIDRLETGQK